MKTFSIVSKSVEEINAFQNKIISQIGERTLHIMQYRYNKKSPEEASKEPNKYFFIHIVNPLSSTWVGSKTSEAEKRSFTTPLMEDRELTCIGFTRDDSGRIWIINAFDDDAYIEYRKSEVKKTKAGKSYRTKEGWYLHIFNIEYYKVRIWKDNEKKYGDIFSFPTNEKAKGIDTFIKNMVLIRDLSNVKEEFALYQAEEERREQERKAEEERQAVEKKRREEERQAWLKHEKEWKEMTKDWEDLGQQAPFTRFPDSPEHEELYNKVLNDPNEKFEQDYYEETDLGGHRGRSFSGRFFNRKYKCYFTCAGDSTD